MKYCFLQKFSVLAAIAALSLALGACGGEDENENQNQNQNQNQTHNHNQHTESIHSVEIYDRGSNDRVADSHGDHWHGQLLLDLNDEDHRSLGFRFLDHDGDEIDIPLSDADYSYEITGYDDSVIDLNTHSDHFYISGASTGDTTLSVEFFHDGDSLYHPAGGAGLSVVVFDSSDEMDFSHISSVHILDRQDDNASIADSHGSHWHGQIGLDVTADSHRSLGFAFFDGNGDEVNLPLGSEDFSYALTGYDPDLVEINPHSDHFHITGKMVGETGLILEIFHDDESIHLASGGAELPVIVFDPTDETDLSNVHEVEIIDRQNDNDVIAEAHGDHWDGSILLDVAADGHRSLGFRFLDASGDEVSVALGTEDLSYTITGYDDELVEINTHSDHFHITGLDVGTTELIFDFHDDGVSFYAPADGAGLSVVIEDSSDEMDALEVGHLEVIDRGLDPRETIDEVHDIGGTPHWDGDLAAGISLTENEEDIVDGDSSWYYRGPAHESPQAVSFGVYVEDADGEEVDLSASPYYEISAAVTDTEYEDVVYFSVSHGDHIHIVGRQGDGSADVVLQVIATEDHPELDAGDVVFETPSFEVSVLPAT